MRRVADIVRIFRDKLQAFGAYIWEDNWRYRRALYLFEKIFCIMTCQGEIVSETTDVTTDIVRLRRHDSLALRTTISNTGANAAIIYEDDVIAGIVQPSESITMPLQGRLSISAKTSSGSTSLTVATMRRCPCGDAPYQEGDYEPIGGNLV